MASSTTTYSTVTETKEEKTPLPFPTLKGMATLALIQHLGGWGSRPAEERIKTEECFQLFQPSLNIICEGDKESRIYPLMSILLQLTSQGERLKVKTLLSDHSYLPDLAVTRHTFTEEWCDRTWTQPVSPLEYAAWVGDTEMVNLFLEHLPSCDLRAEALEQLQKINNEGLEHGKHLSAILALDNAYDTYAAEFKPEYSSIEERDELLLKIGKKQREAGPNFLRLFCDYHHINPRTPNFKIGGSVMIFIAQYMEKMPCHSLLGTEYILLRGEATTQGISWKNMALPPERLVIDHLQPKLFYKHRISEFKTQLKQLQNSVFSSKSACLIL